MPLALVFADKDGPGLEAPGEFKSLTAGTFDKEMLQEVIRRKL